MAVDYTALARTHMAQQVREAAVIQTAIARLWQQMIDPRDPWGSYARFRKAAAVYVGAGHTVSQRTAEQYIEALRGLGGKGLGLAPLKTVDPDQIIESLTASAYKSLDRAARSAAAGQVSNSALATALSQTLGASKRLMLNGGRQRLVDSSGDRGWSRVSDGDPCAFCLMLVSRGPVYTQATGAFKSHDRCGCSVRLIVPGDDGWSPQAREARELWDEHGDLNAVRRTLAARSRAAGLELAA